MGLGMEPKNSRINVCESFEANEYIFIFLHLQAVMSCSVEILQNENKVAKNMNSMFKLFANAFHFSLCQLSALSAKRQTETTFPWKQCTKYF